MTRPDPVTVARKSLKLTPCREDDCWKPRGFRSLRCYEHRGGEDR